jgi:DNA-binding IclR family transcriptional regulator
MSRIIQKKSTRNSKLTFASIAEVLQLPRETVRRKVLTLSKRNYLTFNSTSGIKLGSEYKTIYKNFVAQTTLDLSSVIRKWKNSGALQTLIELGNK